MNTNEGGFSPESEKKVKTKIVLEFMRHGKRDKDDPRPDENIRLNKDGRQMAQEKGEKLNPQKEVALAWGSQLERAQETSMHAMLPELNVNASLEEMEAMVAEEQKVGKKLIVDKRLGYDLSGPAGAETMIAFNEKRYIPYVVNKSDARAIELNDRISTTYTRHVGGFADIIHRYFQSGINFNRIVSKNEEKYEKFGNQMERYLATHNGITEFFITKVIEKTQGMEARNEFVKAIGGGFDLTEGMKVEILNDGGEQKITMEFNLKGVPQKLEITDELLQEIIKERDDYEMNFKPDDTPVVSEAI